MGVHSMYKIFDLRTRKDAEEYYSILEDNVNNNVKVPVAGYGYFRVIGLNKTLNKDELKAFIESVLKIKLPISQESVRSIPKAIPGG